MLRAASFRDCHVHPVQGGYQTQIPLPRPQEPRSQKQNRLPRKSRQLAAPQDDGPRFSGNHHAHSHELVARRRARFHRAVEAAPRQILCASAGAAAVQTAAYGVGLRQIFPDCPLLPRRGRKGGQEPRRILSAGHRDVLCHAGRRVRRNGRGADGSVLRVQRLEGGQRTLPQD